MIHSCRNKQVLAFTVNEMEQWVKSKNIPQQAVQFLFDYFKKTHEEFTMSLPIQDITDFSLQLHSIQNNGKQLLELIINSLIENKSSNLFKTLNRQEEFGISRHVADPLYHVPQLLKNRSVQALLGDTYIITAETYNSNGDIISLRYKFNASNSEEAQRRGDEFVQNLAGRQNKVLLACWQLANERGQRSFKCKLTELMRCAYPDRISYFSTKDKLTFYKDLLDLEATKLIIKKRTIKQKNKKDAIDSCEIPLIQIHQKRQEISNNQVEDYPSYISMTILQDPPQTNDNKLYFVGAGIKHSTLKLHADDTQLAEIIQLRKSQRKDEEYLSFGREYLIFLANLEKTEEKNKTQANKSLLKKLQRLCSLNIIIECPKTINEAIKLKVR